MINILHNNIRLKFKIKLTIKTDKSQININLLIKTRKLLRRNHYIFQTKLLHGSINLNNQLAIN